MQFTVEFSPEILAAAPGLRVVAVEADIDNAPTSDSLWAELERQAESMRLSGMKMEDVNKLPGIHPTRLAYKACGKDPNRYRPSAEALTRRIVKGLELYRTLTAIDFINLLSVRTGHSIGGFDADKIVGSRLTLGVGRAGEPFEAIGRGTLNIAGLPVYRDEYAAIGTPTSDCERTKLSADTKHLLMLVNVYDNSADISTLISDIRNLLALNGATITSLKEIKA